MSSSPKIYYERGMIFFHRGEILDSLNDIRKAISFSQNPHCQKFLDSDLYLVEGRIFNENLSYDEAIISLTRAIEKDPLNFDAYLERAIAYFEKGDYSLALFDYLASGFRPKQIDIEKVETHDVFSFGEGIALGMLKGGKDSTREFVPSLLSSFRGISRTLWAFASNPIPVSKDMIESARACLELLKQITSKESLSKIVPELQKCLKDWDLLEDHVKGELIGYVIGKYSVDIFIGSGSIKILQAYRNLKRANALMNLESIANSQSLAKEITTLSATEWSKRKEVFQNGNLKIQWDKQGKHIKGHKNFIPEQNKSLLTHENPQLLIDKFAGSGRKIGDSIPGKPGYKEVVDFQEFIGYYVHPISKEKIPTNHGRIHYAKDGVHIVPEKPRN